MGRDSGTAQPPGRRAPWRGPGVLGQAGVRQLGDSARQCHTAREGRRVNE